MTGQEPKYWRKRSVSKAALERISFSEGNFWSTSRSLVSKKSVKPSRSCTSSCLHTERPFSDRCTPRMLNMGCESISAYHNHMSDCRQASISSHQCSEEHSTGAEGQHRLGRDPEGTDSVSGLKRPKKIHVMSVSLITRLIPVHCVRVGSPTQG